jgi:hypothetical protein
MLVDVLSWHFVGPNAWNPAHSSEVPLNGQTDPSTMRHILCTLPSICNSNTPLVQDLSGGEFKETTCNSSTPHAQELIGVELTDITGTTTLACLYNCYISQVHIYLSGLGLIYLALLSWSRCTPGLRTGNV